MRPAADLSNRKFLSIRSTGGRLVSLHPAGGSFQLHPAGGSLRFTQRAARSDGVSAPGRAEILPGMELRQLRYFLAVAQDLHFTRAAQRMHVAQPALSAQIRALERELGGPLLDRSTRNVKLTEAGQALAREAAEIVQAADRSRAEVRSIVRRNSQTLAVGCVGAPGDLLEEALDQIAEGRPEVSIDVRTFDYVQIWSSLSAGEVDLVLTYLPFELTQFDDLDVRALVRERRAVVLSASHRLAQRADLRPADLADEVFITHPDEVPESWRDFWLLTDQLGRRPAVHSVKADTVEKWLHLIQRGEGIDTCPAYVSRYYAWPTLRYVPLHDAPPATLALLCRKRTSNPLADALREALLAAAAGHPELQTRSEPGRAGGGPPEPAA